MKKILFAALAACISAVVSASTVTYTADNNTNSLSFLINRFDRLIMDIMNK